MFCASCRNPLISPDALPTPTQMEELLDSLRTSSVPPDLSCHESTIRTSMAALAHYDSQIARLRETLEGMFADRTRLQKYIDACRSAISPIRRLPSELLCEIFALCSPDYDSNSGSDYASSSGYYDSDSDYDFNHFDPEEEILAVVAKYKLLRISRVSAHWHSLIMGTPRFWCGITVDAKQWPLTTDSGKFRGFLQILTTTMERGQSHPLALSVNLLSADSLVSKSVLELLTSHCERWENVSLAVELGQLSMLRHVKGRLDALERLSLDIEGALSHPDAAFEFRAVNAWDLTLNFDRLSITSTVASFLVDLHAADDRERTVQVLGELMGCLTLPCLRELHIICARRNVIPWPVDQFEALSTRSSFQETLCVLELPNVTITEDELVRSLVPLSSLKRLVISDQRLRWTVGDHVLITDSLLARLTCTPESPSALHLVPRLNYFACATFFTFRAKMYLDFIASRVQVNPDRVPFQSILRSIGDAKLEFEAEDRQRLLVMVSKGELQFYVVDGQID
ncbi:hypothetical protein B0H19DRAFT_1316289 [Mycena capillaripes]|nr:hypothetical protein B0H19DRAFT_1316289 [Mycena capillaripes]